MCSVCSVRSDGTDLPTHPAYCQFVTIRDCHIVGFGLPYLGFGQCVKKVVNRYLVNSQPVVEDEQTFYTTEY